jgi:hypothetical protein
MRTAERQFCLDMMKVSWVGTSGINKSDCGIILEIEPIGGLVQTTVPIALGTEITLHTEQGLVEASVTSCEQDAYGYVVNFAIKDHVRHWFPDYTPSFLHSAGCR